MTNNIFTIDGFWTQGECERFMARSEEIGYQPATVETEKGQKIVETVRNNNRILYEDLTLAENLWQKLKPYAPVRIGNSKAVGLNELFRFYKYQAGQEFKRHRDQSFIRNEIEASYYTFMIYLNDNYEGGETKFDTQTVKPKQGTALIFFHDLEHEGGLVRTGIKYVLRTDIMFRLE
ncbi:MAG: 2OG-Fe(II) oxygenase [Bacteroidota bacterium]|nr:2OG-Fe(II) oxygenase [Bacteroidota bacterium]MDP4252501.1 2OG-Fe(II) oxygenase [Bacteroidota bacterium]